MAAGPEPASLTRQAEGLAGDFILESPSGPGQGSFAYLRGRYDQEGRYVLLLKLNGKLGQFKANTYRDPNGLVATYVDFIGDYQAEAEVLEVTPGPIRMFRFGQGQGFSRLSLTYQRQKAPDSARVHVLSRGDLIALVYEFTGGPTAELAKEAALGARPS
jgi:hypothetical protein